MAKTLNFDEPLISIDTAAESVVLFAKLDNLKNRIKCKVAFNTIDDNVSGFNRKMAKQYVENRLEDFAKSLNRQYQSLYGNVGDEMILHNEFFPHEPS